MYTDCKQTARVLYIFWTGVKCQKMSFRPIATNIGNTKGEGEGEGSTFANANAIAITATKKFEKTPSSRFKCAFKGFFKCQRQYLW